MSAKVMIKFVDALDGSEHEITLNNVRAVVDGWKRVGLGFTPLRFTMIWYVKTKQKKLSVYPFLAKGEKIVLVRVKGAWGKKLLEIMTLNCPEELRGKFEFCGAEIFRRMKEKTV